MLDFIDINVEDMRLAKTTTNVSLFMRSNGIKTCLDVKFVSLNGSKSFFDSGILIQSAFNKLRKPYDSISCWK